MESRRLKREYFRTLLLSRERALDRKKKGLWLKKPSYWLNPRNPKVTKLLFKHRSRALTLHLTTIEAGRGRLEGVNGNMLPKYATKHSLLTLCNEQKKQPRLTAIALYWLSVTCSMLLCVNFNIHNSCSWCCYPKCVCTGEWEIRQVQSLVQGYRVSEW